jgi:hypothetical protein
MEMTMMTLDLNPNQKKLRQRKDCLMMKMMKVLDLEKRM